MRIPASKPSRAQHYLVFVLILVLAGCARAGLQPGAQATARDLDDDRILVTVPALAPGAASLSVSGRLNYQPPDMSGQRARQLEIAQRLAVEFDLRLEEEWPIAALNVHCFVFRMNGSSSERDRLIATLAGRDDIDSVQSLQFFSGEASPAPPRDGDPLAGWNAELDERLRALHERATGRTTTIAVIDTGVDVAHEDLHGMRLRTADLVDGRSRIPPEMHGTAVVGVMSARADNGKGIRGYAPDAEVMLFRACWEAAGRRSAVCNTFTLAKAMSLALDAGADIVNLSISGPRDPLLERLGERMVERGQIVIAAGGDRATFPGSIPRSLLAARYALPAELSGASMTLLPGNRYGMRVGTSIMAARLSAAVALIRQLLPQLGLEQLDEALSPDALPPSAEVAALLRMGDSVDQALAE